MRLPRSLAILGIVAGVVALGASALAQSARPSGNLVPADVLTGHIGSGSLNVPGLAPSTLSSPLTVSVAGAESGDAVQCNATSDLEPRIIANQWVSASGTVSLRVFNSDAVEISDSVTATVVCVVLK